MSSLKSPFRIGPDVVMPADGGFSLGAFIDSTEGGEGNIARVVECRLLSLIHDRRARRNR
jgi:hypothetical protein